MGSQLNFQLLNSSTPLLLNSLHLSNSPTLLLKPLLLNGSLLPKLTNTFAPSFDAVASDLPFYFLVNVLNIIGNSTPTCSSSQDDTLHISIIESTHISPKLVKARHQQYNNQDQRIMLVLLKFREAVVVIADSNKSLHLQLTTAPFKKDIRRRSETWITEK